jgi:arsenate reductase (thioredoxin)
MPITPYKTLFLCTGNSARSILSEYLLQRIGRERFEVFSAGSKPTGVVNPYAIRVLRDYYKIDAAAARSKSWEEFKTTHFDFVITVCDNARETCPVWPGQPIIAHWGLEDPAQVTGTDEEIYHKFLYTASLIYRRLELFCSLPLEKIERMKLQAAVQDIAGK